VYAAHLIAKAGRRRGLQTHSQGSTIPAQISKDFLNSMFLQLLEKHFLKDQSKHEIISI
jgi:hypothetical protein